jgi:hypothetical protein
MKAVTTNFAPSHVRRFAVGFAGLIAIPIAWLLYRFAFPAPSAQAGPDTKHWFALQYDLLPGEHARMVAPPYPSARDQRYPGTRLGRAATQPVGGQMYFHAGNTDRCWGWSSGDGTVYSSITYAGTLTKAEIDIEPVLSRLPSPGDWTIRMDSPRHERLRAVQSILRHSLNRPITIEPQAVRRPVIVVRGTYQFRSLGRGRRPNDVQLFTDKLDPAEGAGGGSGSLERFLQHLEDVCGTRIVNEVGSAPDSVAWSNNYSYRNSRDDPAMLNLLLDHLSQQTSLTFDQAAGDVEVFVVRESP